MLIVTVKAGTPGTQKYTREAIFLKEKMMGKSVILYIKGVFYGCKCMRLQSLTLIYILMIKRYRCAQNVCINALLCVLRVVFFGFQNFFSRACGNPYALWMA